MNIHHRATRSRFAPPTLTPALAVCLLAVPMAHASQVVMFWDRPGPYETLDGIEATGGLEVPPEACGFRLGRHGETWPGGWHFGTHGNQGSPLVRQGITYSSSFTGPAEGPIEARGPVHGCSGSGSFAFTTPLGQYGITGSDPAVGNAPVAGSFVADVFDGSDLEWLDAAGQPIKSPPGMGPDPKPPTLPPEFLGQTPSLTNCIRDFANQYHCLDGTAQAAAGTRAATALARGRTGEQLPEPSGVVQMSARIPAPPTASRRASAATAVDVDCPVELVLSGVISRNPDFEADPALHSQYGMDPPVVEYRFRFVPEHVASTPFSVTLSQMDTQVTHSVPLPLPSPEGSRPTGTLQPGSRDLRARLPGGDGGRGGGGSGTARPGDMVGQLPPADVMQGTVRLELLNLVSHAGQPVAMASSPTHYAVRCAQEPEPEPPRPVITTGLPVPPPQPPGDLTAPTGTRTTPVEEAISCRGGQVRGAGCVCPSGQRAVPAGSNRWQCVPAPTRR